MSAFDFTVRLVASIFFGFIIGMERNLTGHVVGIKTNVLVCLSACMFVLFPYIIGSNDIVRNSAQVITGVGFLGSGIIFKDGRNVRGINTAATIWCTAAIGVITSTGRISLAGISTFLLLISNIIFKVVADKINPDYEFDEDGAVYRVSIVCDDTKEFMIRSLIMEEMKSPILRLTSLESIDQQEGKVNIITEFMCKVKKDQIAENMIIKFRIEEGVYDTYWKVIS